jgi:hypothetical protein
MRRKHLINTAFVFLFCTTLSLVTIVCAEDEEQPGGDIQGTEQLHQQVVLTATTNAPAGATGKAELEAENEDGTNTATLAVEVEGLQMGTYTISVTRKSDGGTVVLGMFDIFSSSNEDDDVMVMTNSMGENDQGENENEIEIEFGTEEGLPLPDGLNPMDIGSISISDSNGAVVLTGDFMNSADVMNGKFKAKVAVVAGPAAPTASGLVVVRSKTKKGVRHSKFRLLASGASPNEVLILKINGFDVGTVTADKHGRVRLRELPADFDPESLILMEFDDSDGTNAMTISF